jgi:hypothetical protein
MESGDVHGGSGKFSAAMDIYDREHFFFLSRE